MIAGRQSTQGARCFERRHSWVAHVTPCAQWSRGLDVESSIRQTVRMRNAALQALEASAGWPHRSRTNAVGGTADAGFPDGIAPRPEDYVFLKRRPSIFYGTCVAELLNMQNMLRRDTIIIDTAAEPIATVRVAACRISPAPALI
jgi:Isochorismatase family